MTMKKQDSNILDIIIDKRKEAKEKLESGEMLHDETKKHYENVLGIKKRKSRHKERKLKMPKTFEGKEADAVKEIMESFDPTTANKKEIREFRKALGALSKAKYPKKEKAKKKKKD